MVNFLDILLEEDRRKESLKKSFHTYYCEFLLKFERKINKTQAIERVRGIKSVTVVENVPSPRLDLLNKTTKDFEYTLLGVKFVTNKEVKEQVNMIAYEMAKADSSKDIMNIKGIVAAKPKIESLKKID